MSAEVGVLEGLLWSASERKKEEGMDIKGIRKNLGVNVVGRIRDRDMSQRCRCGKDIME